MVGGALGATGFPSSIASYSFRLVQTNRNASTAPATPKKIATRWRGIGVSTTSGEPSGGRHEHMDSGGLPVPRGIRRTRVDRGRAWRNRQVPRPRRGPVRTDPREV